MAFGDELVEDLHDVDDKEGMAFLNCDQGFLSAFRGTFEHFSSDQASVHRARFSPCCASRRLPIAAHIAFTEAVFTPKPGFCGYLQFSEYPEFLLHVSSRCFRNLAVVTRWSHPHARRPSGLQVGQ
jgi:hypothetical protein